MTVYIRSGCSASHKATFECGCHEVQIIKVSGKSDDFICSLFIGILMLIM